MSESDQRQGSEVIVLIYYDSQGKSRIPSDALRDIALDDGTRRTVAAPVSLVVVL